MEDSLFLCGNAHEVNDGAKLMSVSALECIFHWDSLKVEWAESLYLSMYLHD